MDNLVKQRVIGAIVLVALAVIFVPMLFETPEDELGPVGSNLPTEPDSIVRERIEPLTLPEPPPEPEPAPQVILEEPADPSAANADAAIDAANDSGAGPAAPSQGTAGAPVAPPPPAAKPAPVPPAPTTAPAPASVPQSGWIVQLASLASKDNAMALRERLRGLGYTAFVEETKTAKGVLYRVRVGPELERTAAEALRDRLRQQVDLEGMVTSYP
ncbi:MAG: SPOR domain-containing protein [Gammaproteobacteria bacterium]|nr:SPOR domain-containing protein [Gammaproteobacteria bacterium]